MSQRKEMLMKNMEFVAYEGLNGKPGFQMTLHKSKEDRYYLYVACFRHNGLDRKSTRLNSSHIEESRMPSSA